MTLPRVLIVMLLVGCGGGNVYGTGGGSKAIPPRPPGATYPNWEHICVHVTNPDELSNALNDAGAQGWELVMLAQGALCFKRPRLDTPVLPAAPAAPAAAMH